MAQESPYLSGYVLHRQPYRESSYLMDLWTREQGRLRVVARSARGPRSRFRGQLEPFTPLQLRLAGRHSLKVLAEADVVGLPLDLPGSRLFCAFYVNELIVRLYPAESADPVMYDCYERTLQALSKSDVLTALRYFELTLLEQQGYGLELSQDVDGNQIIASSFYFYQSDRGFMRCDTAQCPGAFPGELLMILKEKKTIPDHWQQLAKCLMREALRPYLGDKPLKSQTAFLSPRRVE